MKNDDYTAHADTLLPDSAAQRLSQSLEQDARRYSRSLHHDTEVKRR